MDSSLRLGRISGIEIGLHYSWVVAFVLIAWSLAGGFFPQAFPGWDEATYWIVGVVSALLLFVSVLLHELSHSYVAMSRGMKVDSIVLFIFGGVSNVKGDARAPEDEFLMAIAGPVTSLLLAAAFWATLQVIGPSGGPVQATLGYLAGINLLLGLFNLLPGFPLDGGRVLRSVLWRTSGSMFEATRTASTVGQGLAYLFIMGGVAIAFLGSFLSGLWLVLVGWFLSNAAESTFRQYAMQETFRDVTVEQMMDPTPAAVSPDLRLQDLVDQFVLGHGLRAVPVVQDGRLVGIATLVDLHKVPPERWSETRVSDVMTSQGLVTVAPGDSMQEALGRLAEGDFDQLPVVVDGRLVGLLGRADIIRYLRVREELGFIPRPRPGDAGQQRRAA